MNFASDNTGGVHPRIMQAIAAANAGNLPSYGADGITGAAQNALRRIFDAPEAAVHFVATGTAANALALSLLTPPWGRVFCHQSGHIQTSESGAPEFYTSGAKLVPVAGAHGRIDPDALAGALHEFGRSSVHAGRNAAISLTNATEWGTVYDPDQVATLADAAYRAGMAAHMDGARFANALAAQDVSPADLSWRAGVDVLTLGGTKNGCMGVEAVLIFDPARAEEFEYRRKRGGHLLSKHRFLSAQILAWLEDGLWLEIAAHATPAWRQCWGRGCKALPARACWRRCRPTAFSRPCRARWSAPPVLRARSSTFGPAITSTTGRGPYRCGWSAVGRRSRRMFRRYWIS
ncbi:beta-eliminating lyase-related protein [Paracoccus sp. DMF-8]|uniref:threonine aldolase family protein n=1 Tax=Paracoccus sp. DMF-8 TaxID=3019445 RepID=UPI0023E7EE1F|nr:beta-eliminating lyase-related protein [Paracoccus sp. DMF-8]MDF3606204.1 beta-eliminating lyase-related protein [Paracoccus sp. DMF-8]